MTSLPALPFLDLEAQRLRRERSLAIVVKLENELKCAEKEDKPGHGSTFELKVAARRRRVIELRKLGYKILDIQRRIADETGVTWSEATIKRDLQSITAEEELEELKRQQDADIALEEDRKVRLEYRYRQIEQLTPRKNPEVHVNIAQQVKVEGTEVMVDLSKFSDDERNALLRAEEALTREETAAGPK